MWLTNFVFFSYLLRNTVIVIDILNVMTMMMMVWILKILDKIVDCRMNEWMNEKKRQWTRANFSFPLFFLLIFVMSFFRFFPITFSLFFGEESFSSFLSFCCLNRSFSFRFSIVNPIGMIISLYNKKIGFPFLLTHTHRESNFDHHHHWSRLNVGWFNPKWIFFSFFFFFFFLLTIAKIKRKRKIILIFAYYL